MSSTALVPSASSQSLTQTTTGKTITSPAPAPAPAPSPVSLPLLHITPKKQHNLVSSPSEPRRAHQNGWIHPRMDEIIRRRSATNFESRNLKNTVISVALILTTFFAPGIIYDFIPNQWTRLVQPYPVYVLWLLRLLLVVNVGVATAPLWRKPDACEDIPLTASQRELMGLPPMSRPATPQEKEQYVTPPRFSRSNTPRSASSSVRHENGGSPLSGRGTPMENGGPFLRTSPYESQRRTSGSMSPFTSGAAFKGGSEKRRLSYTSNRTSPLSFSELDTSGSLQTPTKGNKPSVGLNNKWLYEKGRANTRGTSSRRNSLLL